MAMNPPSNLVEFAKELMPAGMKFCPTDQELIANYLHRKITGGLTTFQTEIVKECDLYGEDEPWQIWDRYKAETVVDMEQNLYFFTRLKSKSTNGKRILRRVGKNEGTWHGEDAGSKINCWSEAEGKDVYLIGFKKRFNYRNPKSEQNGQWIMHEYSLSNTDYVICRLKNNRAAPVNATPLIQLAPSTLQLEDVPERSNSVGVRNVDVNSYVETNQQPKDDRWKEQIDGEKNDPARPKESNGEMNEQKKEKAASSSSSSQANNGVENEQGYEIAKRVDGEMNGQKEKAVPAQAKNDGEKSAQFKGNDEVEKTKKGDNREMNEQKKREKAVSAESKNDDRENERSDGGKKEQKKKKVVDRLLKKVDQVTEASPKTGKRPRVEEEGPEEDGATSSSKDKRPRGNMDLLIKVLGLN